MSEEKAKSAKKKVSILQWKVIATFLVCSVFLFLIVYFSMKKSFTDYEYSMVSEKLASDIIHVEDVLGQGEWEIKDGFLYKGETSTGDCTIENANIEPFIDIENKTGTFSYVFMICSDEGLGWTGDDKTGYEQGHYCRVAGSTKNPNGESIVGTYMAKNVADTLDEKGIYEGVANVDGGMIYCIYKTLLNSEGEIVGAMVVGRNVSAIKSQINSYVNRISIMVLVILTCTFAVMYIIIGRTVNGIIKTDRYLNQIAAGEMPEKPLRITSKDELGKIAATVNRLAGVIRERDVLFTKSHTDELTGLSNRMYLMEYTSKVFPACVRNNRLYATEFIDIDYFKQFNDNYGHHEGDKCIKAISDALKELSDRHVFVSRYGGDEFVIIYTDMDEEKLMVKVKEIQEIVRKIAIKHEFSKASDIVTVTQGIAYGVPSDFPDMTAEIFLKAADSALYEVKKQGRNDARIISMKDFLESKELEKNL